MSLSKPKPGTIRLFSARDLRARKEEAALEARSSLVAFRQMIRPDMRWGWWPEQVSLELQLFYQALIAGKRPKLAIMAPPQHGKSSAAEDLIAWVAGKNPDLKTIYASYSQDLGTRLNNKLRRTIESPRYGGIFDNTRIGSQGWQMNSGLIEYAGHHGSFRNTTVGGGITGQEMHLGVIDDPVKDRAEAQSKTIRDSTWNWFNDVFMTRAAANSGLLIIMTRWHVDDLLGRLILNEPRLRTLVSPAIAEKDDGFRRQGEALFPEFKPLDFLLERKKIMSKASWESEYQQNPFIVGGGVIRIEKMKVIPFWDRSKIKRAVIAVDKAATASGDGAYTCFLLMHDMGPDANPRYIIEDVQRGRWEAREREQRLLQFAQLTRASFKPRYVSLKIAVEQEPGSGGKESAEATLRNLTGFSAFADKVTGRKEVRAEPFVAQVQGGNVGLVAGPWVKGFLEEAEPWPYSRHLDQIDAAAMAFNYLTNKPILDYRIAYAP